MSIHDEQEIERLQNQSEKLRLQRDDAIKIAMLILEHSTPNNGSSKHVHKYAVDMLGVMQNSIEYALSTKV